MRIMKIALVLVVGVLVMVGLLLPAVQVALAGPDAITMTPSPEPSNTPEPTHTSVPPSATSLPPLATLAPQNTSAPQPQNTSVPQPQSTQPPAASSTPVRATARATTAGAVNTSAPAATGGPYRYMVKFVCGLQAPVASGEPPVKPGNYATAINLHNYTSQRINVVRRPALYYTVGSQPPAPVNPSTVEIAPYSVLEVDCNDLWQMTGTRSGTFITGMIDIGARIPLPVAAVYTAAGSGAGISIDVEYIQPFLTP